MKKGQALIEILMAVAIAAVVLVALAGMGTKSTSNSGFSSRQTQATSYAQQIMNYFKTARQDGWNTISSTYTAGTYCYNGTTIASGSWCSIPNTEYTNSIAVTRSTVGANTPEPIGVTVKVRWYEGKGGDAALCGVGYLCSVLTNSFMRY